MALRKITYKPYFGSGKIYARPYGSAAALAEIGNCASLEFAVNEDNKKQSDYTKAGGGTYAQVIRINSMEVTIQANDLNPLNLARSLFGSADSVMSGTVVDEAHTAYKSGLIRLTNPNPSAVVLTNVGNTVTYVAGTDYEVRPEGIYILEAGAIADATPVLADYSYAAYDVVQALTTGAPELELSFGGINEADSGNAVLVDAFRVKLGAAKKLGMIGTDFASLEITGEVLIDSTKSGAGISKYMRVQMV
jgi:hypothetical protein